MLLQILVVSDPKLATEVLQMPKIMDKNRQALVTLDTVSLHFVIAGLTTLFSTSSPMPVYA